MDATLLFKASIESEDNSSTGGSPSVEPEMDMRPLFLADLVLLRAQKDDRASLRFLMNPLLHNNSCLRIIGIDNRWLRVQTEVSIVPGDKFEAAMSYIATRLGNVDLDPRNVVSIFKYKSCFRYQCFLESRFEVLHDIKSESAVTCPTRSSGLGDAVSCSHKKQLSKR